jgi:hypothetical protein
VKGSLAQVNAKRGNLHSEPPVNQNSPLGGTSGGPFQ